MSLLQINNAMSLAEPLLEQQQHQHRHQQPQRKGKGKNYDEDDEIVDNEASSQTKFFLLGGLTGFLIQAVSLGAYALLMANFNGYSLTESRQTMLEDGFFSNNKSDLDENSEGEFFGKGAVMYTVLSVLTQVDLIVYVLIWVGFTCTMTHSGMACIRSQFGRKNQQRYVFVLGVWFLVGIVIGAFGAWSAVDVYLGFPIPFEPILITVAVDLALCYLMVWCFDLGGRSKAIDECQSEYEYVSDSENDSNDEEDMQVACC